MQLRELVQVSQRSTVAIYVVIDHASGVQQRLQSGSGVVISPQVVATCAHVVEPPEVAQAGAKIVDIILTVDVEQRLFSAGQPSEYHGTIRSKRADRDVALVDVPKLTAPAAPWNSSLAEAGDEVFLIGHPDVKCVTPPPTVAVGVIAGVEMHVVAGGGAALMYRVDANIYSGNSGGGLFSRTDGALLGIVTSKGDSLADVAGLLKQHSLSGGTDPALASWVGLLEKTVRDINLRLQPGYGFAVTAADAASQLCP